MPNRLGNSPRYVQESDIKIISELGERAVKLNASKTKYPFYQAKNYLSPTKYGSYLIKQRGGTFYFGVKTYLKAHLE